MAGILTAFDVYGVRSRIRSKDDVRAAAEKWRAAHAAKGIAGYDAPLTENADAIEAYVNHGRWLVDCSCGNGVPTSPRSIATEAVCFSCGTVWTSIVYPDDVEAIESALTRRPAAQNRNWRSGESVATLEAENAFHMRGGR